MIEERWLPVTETGFEDFYEVSDRGRVRSVTRTSGRGTYQGRILRPGKHPQGYLGVSLCRQGDRRSVLIHKLVLMAFVGPCPPGMETRHRDGDRENNLLGNLRWGTSAENEHDKRRHGTVSRGERNGRAKLTEEQVREIIWRHANGESQKALAAAYGVAQPTVSRFTTGVRWGHLR